MNEAVMQKAKELAQLIRYSPEYICMMAAQEAAAGEEALEAISREYDDTRRAVEDMTLAEEPDYEQIMAGSRELEELRKKYNAHPLAQAVNQSRRDFNEMMNAVNRELKSVLNPDGPDAPAGCSGSCAGCSGDTSCPGTAGRCADWPQCSDRGTACRSWHQQNPVG